jgi:glyoxylase-like metal-dependent hydrolase (beta-lactamase superfamily II)
LIERRLLFSGDHLLPKISPNIGLHPQSSADPLADYLRSLDRIGRLEVDQIFPAHGDPFTDHRGRLAVIKQHHQERKEALLRLAAKTPLTGWQLAAQLFAGIMERNVFQKRLALQETLAHCQSLAEEDRMQKLSEPSRVRWLAA